MNTVRCRRRSLWFMSKNFRPFRLQPPDAPLPSLCHVTLQRGRLPSSPSGRVVKVWASPFASRLAATPGRIEFVSCGLVIHLLLLSTWPRDHAVTFSYGLGNVCPKRTFTSLIWYTPRRTGTAALGCVSAAGGILRPSVEHSRGRLCHKMHAAWRRNRNDSRSECRPVPLPVVGSGALRGWRAEDNQAAEPKDAPRVLLVSSPGLVRGRTNKLVLRGVNLAQTTGASIDGLAAPETPSSTSQPGTPSPTTQPASSQPAAITAFAVRVTSKAKSDPPKSFEAARAGDSQVDLEIDIPQSPGAPEVTLVLATDHGQAKTPPLALLDAQEVTDEKEPNDGFRQAQPVEIGKAIRGLIQAPGDVDVYQFIGRTGQKVRFEVLAARAGSLLDSTISLYDARGRVLASNDDSSLGNDSLLLVTLTSDGVYYLSVADANGTGSAVHGYLIKLEPQ